jgi:hypothetical protein
MLGAFHGVSIRGLKQHLFSTESYSVISSPLGTELMRKRVGQTIEGAVAIVLKDKISTEGVGVQFRDQDNRGTFLQLEKDIPYLLVQFGIFISREKQKAVIS